jgi:hypothetical protein
MAKIFDDTAGIQEIFGKSRSRDMKKIKLPRFCICQSDVIISYRFMAGGLPTRFSINIARISFSGSVKTSSMADTPS